ncbi:hypothetical protein, partial [Phascolarctobacterium succinatutens]|uniref:hypothetical protein n=1 Tax=Phascolarctobacterium succinatutens TaxID=626940 RepID=UPI003FD6FB53
KEENVKDFCHKRHFFDIDVNSACSTAKPLLTVCVIKRQHKIHQKSPSSADTEKANLRMQKACYPHELQALFFLLRFLLITYVSTSTASTACKRLRV